MDAHTHTYICIYIYMLTNMLLILQSYNIIRARSCEYTHTYVYIYNIAISCLVNSVHYCPQLIPLCNIAIALFDVVSFINVIKFCKPLSKLDLPTLRKGSREERTQRKK